MSNPSRLVWGDQMGFWRRSGEFRAAPADASLRLQAGNVHVWAVLLKETSDTVCQLSHLLVDDERARSARLACEIDRGRYVAAHARLREILASYKGCRPQDVRFRYTDLGKPEISAPASLNSLVFSLTQSEDLALCAVTRGRRVGIDIERIRPFPDAQEIAETYFTGRECKALAALSGEELHLAFVALWTCKEAYLKACGQGLHGGLDTAEFHFAANGQARLRSISGSNEAAGHWSVRMLQTIPGYLGALVMNGPDAVVELKYR